MRSPDSSFSRDDTLAVLLALSLVFLISSGRAQDPQDQAQPQKTAAYASLPEALTATETGQKFTVVQPGGVGVYRYTRTVSGAIFEGVELSGPNAGPFVAQRKEEAKSPALAPGLLTHLWGTNAREWDGRVIPNELAATPPTLNLLPDPFNPANESGSNEPHRDLNTRETSDPLGGFNAMRLTFTAANQQLFFSQGEGAAVKGVWTAPLGEPLRLRIWAKALSGPRHYFFGEPSSRLDLTEDWKEYRVNLIPKAPGNLTFGTGSGNTDGVAALAGVGIYDEYAGEDLPDLGRLLDDQNGAHGTMPLKVRASIPFTPEGAIDNAVMGAGVRIFTGPAMPETPAYTLGVWFSPDEIENPSYGTAITIADHPEKAAKYSQGMIGIYSDKNTSISDRGRLRPFPTNNVGSKRTGQYLIGQGWQHLALTVKNGLTTPYINGIPIYEARQETWIPPRFHGLTVGYYMPNLKRQNANRYLPGRWQGAYVARKALDDGEILQMDRHGRDRLRVSGIEPARRRAVVFGLGGADVAKPESWWWHLCENYDLSPRLHAHLEAQNTGSIIAWATAERLNFLTRQILAAADSYDEVWCFVPSGGSDESMWAAGGHSFDAYKKHFLDYLKTLRAIHPKVRIAAATALPRARANGSLKLEQIRQAWNDDLRTHSPGMGIDLLLDIGLGTERIGLDGTITDETRDGGTLMGNWRVASASVSHQRQPPAKLTLSAIDGDSMSAACPAGTFVQEDVYRRLVTPHGSGRIVEVSGDGTQAKVSTLGYTPTKYQREQDDQHARDSIPRSTLWEGPLAEGEWSIAHDSNYYLNGTNQTYPGGRILGDLLAPLVQQSLNAPPP